MEKEEREMIKDFVENEREMFQDMLEIKDKIIKKLISAMVIIILIISLSSALTAHYFIDNYFNSNYEYPDTTIQNSNSNINVNKK